MPSALERREHATAYVRSAGPGPCALKIGLLVDSERTSKYVYDLARWAATQPDLEISHLIIHAPDAVSSSRLQKVATSLRVRGAYHVLGRALFALIVRSERMLLRRSAVHRDHFASFPLHEVVRESIRVRPRLSKSGLAYRFSDEDVDTIEGLGLDLLIRCGSGILRGEILGAARLGVISFHHGDNRVNRGGPAGFWESYYGWPKTGFVLQRLTEELDGGEVLMRGAFRTQSIFSLNQAHLYSKANVHLKTLLKRVAAAGALPEPEPFFPYSARLYKAPEFHQGLLYGLKATARLGGKAARRILGVRQRWELSFAEADWRKTVLWRSRSPKVPRGRFWADPFLVTRDGRTYCFVEEYVYKTGRGHIVALKVGKDDVEELGPALVEPFHLSFPFVFEYDGSLYMCPETQEEHQIRIYRCTEFPLKWELAAIPMQDVSAVDTMLFTAGGTWWMLTNIDESGTGEHCSELYLFSADSPLATTWTPHPQNPILIDPERARNAGLIVEDGRIYRVAQRQGFEQYGAGLSIWEVAEISTERYREVLVGNIEPAYRDRLLGTHHLSTSGTVTVVDHVSRAFVP
jgi:hypothetical protein